MQLKNKMMLIVFLMLSVVGFTQQEQTFELTQEQLDNIGKSETALKEWFKDVETPGVKIEGQHMIFSKEAQKLISDVPYRNSVYKEEYSFIDVKESLSRFETQKAFWQMLVLYPDHKDEVVRYIYAYDKVLPTDKVLIASFYTYAFFDPEITEIKNGKPNVKRPDIFEEYLRRTREIVGYIEHFRNEEKKTKS